MKLEVQQALQASRNDAFAQSETAGDASMADDEKLTELSDEVLDRAQGVTETAHLKLEANGAAVEGDSSKVVCNAGLRSDGESVQAKKPKKAISN